MAQINWATGSKEKHISTTTGPIPKPEACMATAKADLLAAGHTAEAALLGEGSLAMVWGRLSVTGKAEHLKFWVENCNVREKSSVPKRGEEEEDCGDRTASCPSRR
jgi:hypothetical protein